jgi:hypothetical protein
VGAIAESGHTHSEQAILAVSFANTCSLFLAISVFPGWEVPRLGVAGFEFFVHTG